jgi:hypothetical protein
LGDGNVVERIFNTSMAVIGMIHLMPLPGSPRFGGSLNEVVRAALADAKALEDGGIDGILIENYGDYPYLPRRVAVETTASMVGVVKELVDEIHSPFGINVLANDYVTELAVAYATGGKFIRVEAYVDTVLTDTGALKPASSEIQRYKRSLGTDLSIFADIQAKHTYPVVSKELTVSAKEAERRGLADAVIVTGTETGAQTPAKEVMEVRHVVSIPVIVGAGITAENIAEYREVADGFVVGTYLKQGGITEKPVDVDKVRKLMGAVKKIR